MSELYDPPREPAAIVADTGLFVACGRQQNNKYAALERFVRRNGLTLLIPERIYEELGGAPDRSTPGQTPIDSAIDSGWVTVADPLDYSNSTVATVMDDVRGRIASGSNRPEDTIEKADTALAAVTVQLLDSGSAAFAYLITTDVDAGEATVSALEAHGFGEQVEFVDGFDLINEIT
ncbi:hypothetical protein B4589_017230 (plasmid) [Halolamina sp. CBA1230]|uniref:hypothetical protein n=1 Tax=Halolamina sp. CBA1230 TaxID=1853690 RepID=UPI0009A1BE4D|nr:hypothetical protein [Halolamina sp. CBA1230]QKY22148.1 hypothetical protein B4589_017230 [Halolamina sp. CBA1230]